VIPIFDKWTASVIGAMAAVLCATASAQTGGAYQIRKSQFNGGGGSSAGGTYVVSGTAGQPDAGEVSGGTYEVDGGFWVAETCAEASDCADEDGNGTRDDNCVWSECLGGSGTCNNVQLIQFADMGGAFGSCEPDGFANVHDKNHALSCFAGTNTCDPINIDAGGAFGSCIQDGFCNIHDANHALAAFAGTTTCSCPSGPLPEIAAEVWGAVTLRLEQGTGQRDRDRDHGPVVVDVFIDGPVDALRSYQLDATVTGGKSGRIELIDIYIAERKDAVFAERSDAFDAFNIGNGQMLAGLYADDGVGIRDSAYLATFTFEPTKDASGEFVIDLTIDEESQTFLVAPENGVVEIEKTEPAIVAF
jgi:hypothetical protein